MKSWDKSCILVPGSWEALLTSIADGKGRYEKAKALPKVIPWITEGTAWGIWSPGSRVAKSFQNTKKAAQNHLSWKRAPWSSSPIFKGSFLNNSTAFMQGPAQHPRKKHQILLQVLPKSQESQMPLKMQPPLHPSRLLCIYSRSKK